jgi:hypothetical protein
LDIVAVRTKAITTGFNFWILVIETKRSELDTIVGLPQLLTYAQQGLARQETVWGLVTNGMRYQFIYLERGERITYTQMPFLNLFEVQSAIALLQVLKAIRQL